ncbi:multiple epidermal growth factor-like domains protein 10 [Branchiostoma floridae]|uniref:Multiple epidermal growth factor-like domains protein 10 n=1 Tax=Branchiostoma floridae TaxID=7739 RepID=A0A9J7MZ22_BRAFL|nr:multiple epidermal growth factor-like domains protein 10 [Branchiostoma floridae]
MPFTTVETIVTNLTVTACPIGRFGRFCAERCQCYNGASCHSFNGACRCAPGWRGRNCNIEYSVLSIESPTTDLIDLRYGQDLQLRCIGHNIQVTNVTWLFGNNSPDITISGSTSTLHYKSFLPEHEGNVTCEAFATNGDKFRVTEQIRIAGCQDNFYGQECNRVCNCTEWQTCYRDMGCAPGDAHYGPGRP